MYFIVRWKKRERISVGLNFVLFPGEFCLTYIQFGQVRSYATGIIVLYKQLHLFQEEQILFWNLYIVKTETYIWPDKWGVTSNEYNVT